MRVFKKILKFIARNQPYKDFQDFDLEYLLWISNLYLKIKDLPGHIAEIGVADGRNTILFWKLIKLHNEQSVRQYIGFDTFEGYTERDFKNDTNLDNPTQRRRWKNNSLNKVLKRCFDNDVEDLVEVFEGDAVDLVPFILKNHTGKKFQRGNGRFALVYIDCNAYLPAIKSMEAFLPYMVPGGIIAIDEKFQWGETNAIIDFAKKHSLNLEKFGSNEVPISLKVTSPKIK